MVVNPPTEPGVYWVNVRKSLVDPHEHRNKPKSFQESIHGLSTVMIDGPMLVRVRGYAPFFRVELLEQFGEGRDLSPVIESKNWTVTFLSEVKQP